MANAEYLFGWIKLNKLKTLILNIQVYLFNQKYILITLSLERGHSYLNKWPDNLNIIFLRISWLGLLIDRVIRSSSKTLCEK